MTLAASLRVGAGLMSSALLWVGFGLAAGLFAAVSLPTLTGHRSFTILSGSMEPAISTGDVIVTRPMSPLAINVGDIVTFRDPSNDTRLVTHRVRRVEIGGGVAKFETKGDANNTAERWSVLADGQVGLVTYRVPKLGYVLEWLTRRWPRALILTLPALILGIVALVDIWRPSEHRARARVRTQASRCCHWSRRARAS